MKTPTQLQREIDEFLGRASRIRRGMPPLRQQNTPDEVDRRRSAQAEIRRLEEQVARRRPAPPTYPTGAGVWRILDD